MNVIFSALFLIAGIYSITNLKKTYYQAKSFFILANTQSSLEEYLIKEKCKTFIGMCSLFTWLKMQVLNLYHRRHRRIQNSLKYIK